MTRTSRLVEALSILTFLVCGGLAVLLGVVWSSDPLALCGALLLCIACHLLVSPSC